MSMQIWKDIEGYKGHYQISNYGNIRSLKKDAFLMKGGYLKGYKIINLWKNGTGKMFRVHRLVAAAFIPNPDNKPCIDHIDGNRANNHADNLRWVTVKENQNNPITKSKWIGKKANPHHEKAVEQIKNGIVVNVFVSIQEAARKGNFSATAICKVCKGKGNLHKGYKWRYKKMRTKKRQPDYGAISRSSVRRDFQRVQRYPTEEKRPQIKELPKINAERRVIHISETSAYAKFARYIVGKLVRLKEKANVGGNSWYCEFVHDDDRKALNMAAGWSDNKKLYLLDGVKFK